MTEQTKLSIRTLTSEHADGLNPPGIRPSAHAALVAMREGGYAWGLLLDGVPIGFGALAPDGELVLYLSPAHQRQGYGRILLPNLVRRAFASGKPRVHAKARKGSGGAALAFSAGFEQVGSSENELFFEMKAP
jgi:GNAT superfamily N-acetyltransferase